MEANGWNGWKRDTGARWMFGGRLAEFIEIWRNAITFPVFIFCTHYELGETDPDKGHVVEGT